MTEQERIDAARIQGIETRARYAVKHDRKLGPWFDWAALMRGIRDTGGPQWDSPYPRLRAAVDRLVADGTILEPEHGVFARPGAPARYLAAFQPQVWINDEAVDCDSPTEEWEVTEVLSTFERRFIGEEIDAGEATVHATDEAPRLLAVLDPANDVHIHARIHPYTITIRRQESAPAADPTVGSTVPGEDDA